jgi:HlyD family type I secretion membrane fusion protein
MPAFPVSQPRSHDAAALRVRQFESATAEVVARAYPGAQRATLYTLAALVVAVVIFMCVFKLERVVDAPGRLMPIAGAITVQPLEKAIISRVLVHVGDVVKKGQVLANCDPTFATANLVQLEQKIQSLQAQVRRMEAEQAGTALPDTAKNSYDTMQATIFYQRQVEFTSGVSDFDQRIHSTEADIAGLRQKIKDNRTRLEISQKAEDMNTALVKDGYVSQLDLLNAQAQRVGLASDLAQSQSTLESSLHSLESLKQQRKQYIDKWNSENLNNLASTKDDLDAAQQDYAKAKMVSELVDLVSPEDAVVVKVPSLSPGGVATDAQPLFSLVPLNAPLEIAAHVDAKEIGFLKVGDPVTIKFDAYKFLEHGTGTGVVKTISEDAFTEASIQDSFQSGGQQASAPAPVEPYFETRITLNEVKLHDVSRSFRLTPGMTVEADIVVGKRTIMWYLLGGALRSGAEAMREP